MTGRRRRSEEAPGHLLGLTTRSGIDELKHVNRHDEAPKTVPSLDTCSFTAKRQPESGIYYKNLTTKLMV